MASIHREFWFECDGAEYRFMVHEATYQHFKNLIGLPLKPTTYDRIMKWEEDYLKDKEDDALHPVRMEETRSIAKGLL